MKITSDNLEVIAAKCYTNTSCLSTEEFFEDLNKHKIIKKLARKISKNNSKNLRLLTNHIICFTNNFEINFSKQLLLMDCNETEKKVIRAVLLYLGFLRKTEYTNTLLDLETIKMLKEMDQ
jgi:hypothetical protein